MIFNSFQFLWLFPLIFAFYWGLNKLDVRQSHRLSKYFLLIVSLGVYMQWNFWFGIVLISIAAITYFGAILIDRASSNQIGGVSNVLILIVLLALAPLLSFKYFNFITESGASVLQWIGIDVARPASLRWIVPLGLSFYTFQVIGYVVQVYRKEIAPERNWWDFLLFVSFFPQILCVPISKASDLLPQIKAEQQFDYEKAVSGLRMALWGMFLKVVLADRLGLYVDTVYNAPEAHSGATHILAAVMYSLQIYGDFAGYSYMAVGTAKLLGIQLITNFNRPYWAQSVSEFWKRWNISLTKWLTNNIYISLGGNRRGSARTYVNIIITFLVSGIWHGANLTFIFWGILHGLFQSVEKFFGLNRTESHGLIRIIRTLFTFSLVTVAWIYFRSPSIAFANEYIVQIFHNSGGIYVDTLTFAHIAVGLIIVVAIEFMMEIYPRRFYRILSNKICRWSGYLVLATLILLLGVFDAGQFIYVQF